MVIKFNDAFPIVLMLVLGTANIAMMIFCWFEIRDRKVVWLVIILSLIGSFIGYLWALEWFTHLLLKLLRTG